MREFTIEDLIDIFMKNITVIILGAICAGIMGYIYSVNIKVPHYESSAKIILVKSFGNVEELANLLNGNSAALTANDITLNQKLVATYSEIIRSRTVIEDVINSLNLKTTYDELVKAVSVSTVKDTEVINISVETENSMLSADIANKLVESFKNEVNRIYKIENVQVVDKAIPQNKVVNISIIKNIAIFFVGALVLIYGMYFLKEYLNNKVSKIEDLEALDLNVLAKIPMYVQGGKR